MNNKTIDKKQSRKNVFSSTQFVLLIVNILLMLLCYSVNNNFFSKYNMSTLFRQMSFVAIVAFAQTLVLILGDIDLSVGSIACLMATVTAMLMTQTSLNPYFVMAIGLILGMVCGLFNAVLITVFKITPFIITLATSEIFTGIVYVLTEGGSILNIPSSFTAMGQGMMGGILPIPTIIMLAIGLCLYYILHSTPFGRRLYAIGGNSTAARLVGIDVKRNRQLVYMISGCLSALAGILMMSRLGLSQPTVGINWVMPSVTAAVLGGTSMTGGRGSIWGTMIGALLMTIISSTIVVLRISTYAESVVVGAVIIIAVIIDAVRTNYSKK